MYGYKASIDFVAMFSEINYLIGTAFHNLPKLPTVGPLLDMYTCNILITLKYLTTLPFYKQFKVYYKSQGNIYDAYQLPVLQLVNLSN